MATSPATYDYSSYLSQVGNYKRKDPATLLSRATAAANLLYDPQRVAEEQAAQTNEIEHINNLAKLKASNVGVEDSLAYNNAQAKKAAAIRAAGSGAIGSSGLADYLNNEADAATQAQRLNIAATLAANNAAEINSYGTLSRQSQTNLKNIEANRGNTANTLYNQYEDAQDAAENAWNTNAQQTAIGIGSGEMTAADINMRADNAAKALAEQRYEADLPYNAMTQYQKGQLDLDTTVAMGKTSGGKSSSGSSGSGSRSSSGYSANSTVPSAPVAKTVKAGTAINLSNTSTPVSLRDAAAAKGINVGYDASTGSVTIGRKTYSKAQLTAMGGYISNGRWKLPASSLGSILAGA